MKKDNDKLQQFMLEYSKENDNLEKRISELEEKIKNNWPEVYNQIIEDD